MIAVVTCVEFADVLVITLPRNVSQFSKVFVVTTPEDRETQRVAHKHCAHALLTREFRRNGAPFAKFSALEWALDQVGRFGWVCVLDVDIVLPEAFGSHPFDRSKLTTPRRRMLPELLPAALPAESEWTKLQRDPLPDHWSGYCHVFHAESPHLAGKEWWGRDWATAGGGDTHFQDHWPRGARARTPFDVLHLGPTGENWCGRVTPGVDGEAPPQAVQRAAMQRDYVQQRQAGALR